MISTDDPYPGYQRLREQGPVCWDDERAAFLVTSYAEAAAVLHGPGWSSDLGRNPALAARFDSGGLGGGSLRSTLLLMDQPTTPGSAGCWLRRSPLVPSTPCGPGSPRWSSPSPVRCMLRPPAEIYLSVIPARRNHAQVDLACADHR